MGEWISKCCVGESCNVDGCEEPPFAKVEETIFFDDPMKARHPLTAYLCKPHFTVVMGARGVHFRMRLHERGHGPSEATHNELNRPSQKTGQPDE